MALHARTRTLLAVGVTALAAALVLFGLLASWDHQHTSVTSRSFFSGEFDIDFYLGHMGVSGNGFSQSQDYTSSGASEELRLTMTETKVLVWTGFVVALASAALLALPLTPLRVGGWTKGAALGGLALLVVVALVTAALFAYNFPQTKEGAHGANDTDTSFWGSAGGTTWGPGAAWYASVAAGVAALAALVVALLPTAPAPVHAAPVAMRAPMVAPPGAPADAMATLRMRLARGEITLDEFERARLALES